MRDRRRLTARAALAATAPLTFLGIAQALAASDIETATTPGSGELTMCRDWFVYASCSTYHRVELPQRVAIGDDIDVIFGSNNKDYIFHVVRIVRHGKNCRILSSASEPSGKGERIDVPNCQKAQSPAAAGNPEAQIHEKPAALR